MTATRLCITAFNFNACAVEKQGPYGQVGLVLQLLDLLNKRFGVKATGSAIKAKGYRDIGARLTTGDGYFK